MKNPSRQVLSTFISFIPLVVSFFSLFLTSASAARYDLAQPLLEGKHFDHLYLMNLGPALVLLGKYSSQVELMFGFSGFISPASCEGRNGYDKSGEITAIVKTQCASKDGRSFEKSSVVRLTNESARNIGFFSEHLRYSEMIPDSCNDVRNVFFKVLFWNEHVDTSAKFDSTFSSFTEDDQVFQHGYTFTFIDFQTAKAIKAGTFNYYQDSIPDVINKKDRTITVQEILWEEITKHR